MYIYIVMSMRWQGDYLKYTDDKPKPRAIFCFMKHHLNSTSVQCSWQCDRDLHLLTHWLQLARCIITVYYIIWHTVLHIDFWHAMIWHTSIILSSTPCGTHWLTQWCHTLSDMLYCWHTGWSNVFYNRFNRQHTYLLVVSLLPCVCWNNFTLKFAQIKCQAKNV